MLSIGARGRIVLPSSVRSQLHLREGDQLLLTISADGALQMEAVRSRVRQALGLYRHLKGESSVVDELLADRRQEVRREDGDELGT